jgi:hypothetical protein
LDDEGFAFLTFGIAPVKIRRLTALKNADTKRADKKFLLRGDYTRE